MNWLRRLPGFRRSPPGLETAVLRRLPAACVWSSVVPMLAIAARRMFESGPFLEAVWRPGDIFAVACMLLAWTALLTVAILAATVWVMKGPAYVADAYPVADADHPGPPVLQGTQTRLLQR